MGDYELTGLKNKGRTAVDFEHGWGLLSPENQEKMELILAECLFNIGHRACMECSPHLWWDLNRSQ
jgi:hypothetical protein